MKKVVYSTQALKALARHRNEATRIREKLHRYAETGAGDVTQLVASHFKRLRAGDFRILFEEDANTLYVNDIGSRGRIYE